jgi:glycosyltransferase involved in cell wall biosynthesis
MSRPKTICFDIRALQIGHQNRGIGMYISSLLEHLPADGNNYILYCFDKSNPVEELDLKLRFKYELIQTETVNTVLESPSKVIDILRLVYHHFMPLRHKKPDVFVQFDAQFGLPRWRKTKKIVIGYDLIPLIMRNEYNPSVRYTWRHSVGRRAKLRGVLRAMYYGFRYKLTYRAYKKADKIFCISQATAQSFAELLHIKKRRLEVIPLAPVLSKTIPDESIVKDIVKPYIFYVGGTDKRKRIADIVRAFNIVRGRGKDIALVFAGNEFKQSETIPDIEGRDAILTSPYRKDIHLVGFVTNEQKEGLYKNALVFMFTSQYEGFGLPVIEAMRASCPVIAYNNSSIPEVAGEAAILVPTYDYLSLAASVCALQNSELREKIIAAGLSQSKRFTWEKYTKTFLQTLAT